MKRVLIIVLLMMIALPSKVKASELYRAKATAYCLQGKTASGVILDGTYKNVVASKPEWIGKLMMVWIDKGDHQPHYENFLGYYAIEDTSTKKSIRETGKVIDVYLPTYDECMEFGAPDVIYEVIDGNG